MNLTNVNNLGTPMTAITTTYVDLVDIRLQSAQTPFDKFTEYTRTANLSNVHISEKSMKCLSLLKYKLFTQPQISNNLHALFEKSRVSTHTPTLHTHTCTH